MLWWPLPDLGLWWIKFKPICSQLEKPANWIILDLGVRDNRYQGQVIFVKKFNIVDTLWVVGRYLTRIRVLWVWTYWMQGFICRALPCRSYLLCLISWLTITLYSFTEDVKTPVSKSRPAAAATSQKKSEAKIETKVIQVPDMDDAAAFFTPTATREDIEVTSDDFDHIFIESANP